MFLAAVFSFLVKTNTKFGILALKFEIQIWNTKFGILVAQKTHVN